MKLQVVFDDQGTIIATAEVADQSEDLRAEIMPDDGQSLVEIDLPEPYAQMEPIERHERLMVDTSAAHPTLIKRPGVGEGEGR